MNGADAATARLFARQRFGARPGLDTMRALLERLGRPDRTFDAVLVAGTNGKGSTAAGLASMLRASGRRVGRYASPHLTWPGERVEVDGVPIPFASPPLLWKMKCSTHREKDAADLVFLRRLMEP